MNHLEENLPADQEAHLIMDQLPYPPECCGATLAEAEKAQAIPLPFLSYQQLLVESGRTLFCVDHRKNDPSRNLPQCVRIGDGYLPMAGSLEWRPNSFH